MRLRIVRHYYVTLLDADADFIKAEAEDRDVDWEDIIFKYGFEHFIEDDLEDCIDYEEVTVLE